MRVGTVREIKDNEFRVGLTPESVRELHAHGHEVWIETGAGLGIGNSDRDYEDAGGLIKPAAEVFAGCELVVKVKEPQPAERAMLRAGQVLFTYLHLAPDPDQTADLVSIGRHRHRLRNRHRVRRVAAAAQADEPGRRPHGGAGGGLGAREGARRARRAARRRAGRVPRPR